MTRKHESLLKLLRDELNSIASSILEPEETNAIISALWIKSGQDFNACKQAILDLGGKKPSAKIKSFRKNGLKYLEKFHTSKEQKDSSQSTEKAQPNLFRGKDNVKAKKKNTYARDDEDSHSTFLTILSKVNYNYKHILIGIVAMLMLGAASVFLLVEKFDANEKTIAFLCKNMHGVGQMNLMCE